MHQIIFVTAWSRKHWLVGRKTFGLIWLKYFKLQPDSCLGKRGAGATVGHSCGLQKPQGNWLRRIQGGSRGERGLAMPAAAHHLSQHLDGMVLKPSCHSSRCLPGRHRNMKWGLQLHSYEETCEEGAPTRHRSQPWHLPPPPFALKITLLSFHKASSSFLLLNNRQHLGFPEVLSKKK